MQLTVIWPRASHMKNTEPVFAPTAIESIELIEPIELTEPLPVATVTTRLP